jgi:chromosome partitioning protein
LRLGCRRRDSITLYLDGLYSRPRRPYPQTLAVHSRRRFKEARARLHHVAQRLMHVLTCINQKGGCGKTTTAVNLAGALAARGDRVLLVDLDPQAHATLALGCAVENDPSMIDVFCDRATMLEVAQRAPGGVWLAPATAQLSEYEDLAARMVRPEQTLREALAGVASSYDFAILDCSPRADGVLAANALRAADTALLIVETGVFAIQGALKALKILDEVAATLETPFVVRAVGTMFDRRTRIARDLLVGMQAQLGPLLFETAIRESVRLREAAAAGVPVQLLDPRSRAAEDFRELAEEVHVHAAAEAELKAVEHRSGALDSRARARPAPFRRSSPMIPELAPSSDEV